MLRTVIIDDDEDARSTLRSFLVQYCPNVEIVAEADGVSSGYKAIMIQDPQLVFLDIQMEDGTGFDLLEKIRNPQFNVVFTTAFDEFAIKAFKYSAIDYLLKPIDPDELIKAVTKIRNQEDGYLERFEELKNATNGVLNRITLSAHDGITVVHIDSILRLESDSNYTHFFLKSGEKITVPKSLKEYEAILPSHLFFRTHQSHIINLNFVKKYVKEDGGYILMEDGSEVLVARRRKDEFLHILTGH
jgi:two-component system, LytTR family, response regulator